MYVSNINNRVISNWNVKLSKGRVLVEETPEQSKEVVYLCLMATGEESTQTENSTTNHEVFNFILNSNVASCRTSFDLSRVDQNDLDKFELIKLVNLLKISHDELNHRLFVINSERNKFRESYFT